MNIQGKDFTDIKQNSLRGLKYSWWFREACASYANLLYEIASSLFSLRCELPERLSAGIALLIIPLIFVFIPYVAFRYMRRANTREESFSSILYSDTLIDYATFMENLTK